MIAAKKRLNSEVFPKVMAAVHELITHVRETDIFSKYVSELEYREEEERNRLRMRERERRRLALGDGYITEEEES